MFPEPYEPSTDDDGDEMPPDWVPGPLVLPDRDYEDHNTRPGRSFWPVAA